MRSLHALLACLALLLVLPRGWADGDASPGPFHRIRVIDFPTDIGPVLAAYIDRQLSNAEENGTDCIVLRIDSPGGTVKHSMEISDRLLEVPARIHVIAWVPTMAYSGAAMVALACDEIIMGPDANLGDAQPGMQVAEGWRPVGEKAESPLRAKFRAYADRNGYPAALAEAMVSARLEVLRVKDRTGAEHFVEGKAFRDMEADAEAFPGVKRSELVQVGPPVVREEELLTLTTGEAAATGFLLRRFEGGEAYPADEAALFDVLQADDAVVDRVGLSFSERASRTLLQIAGVLAALVAISLIVLLWQGPGLMTIVGGAALVLVLLITATADLLHGFPLFLIGLGVLLLAAEVFVIPGFGIAGILGIAALGSGFLFLVGGATFDDTSGVTSQLVVAFGLQFVLTVLLGIVALSFLSRLLPTFGPGRRMLLTAPPGPVAATRATEAVALRPGQRGVAASALRPAGAAEFDGVRVDVLTDGAWVAPGAAVEVVRQEGAHVTVRAIDVPPAEAPL